MPVLSPMLFSLLRHRHRNHWQRSPRILLQYTMSIRHLRSDATLKAIEDAAEKKSPVVALYNYPSFSGAFSALFAHLYHSHFQLPCLILPFSSVVPFRVDDLCFEGLEKCYFLDFIGPEGFARELSNRTSCEVICFDHRKSEFSKIPFLRDCAEKCTFHVDIRKGSVRAVYEHFSSQVVADSLLKSNDQLCIKELLKYLEDGDLRQWSLPGIQAFNIGISEWKSKMNCITNPYMYEQLLGMRAEELIIRGQATLSKRKNAAQGFLIKPFKLRLGRDFYGECLGVTADSDPDLSDEIGKELSLKSAAAGLRPIGVVVFMQQRNLKMCLRSTDSSTDTSVIAKAYGGGGSPSSSSFIIRMDEYNQWFPLKSSG